LNEQDYKFDKRHFVSYKNNFKWRRNMGREISLFSDYHTQENSLTNYCGLILKLLYEENPKGFEEVLVTLISDDINITVGPTFSQQQK
jgi:hypothetical protein